MLLDGRYARREEKLACAASLRNGGGTDDLRGNGLA